MKDTNIIIFEGNYLNGKRNVQGKEYYENGKILFEGGCYGWRRWNRIIYNKQGKKECEIKCGRGKVKKYNIYGDILFEGEYLDGERNEKGKEYSYGNILIYEGEYLNGKRNGKGKEYNLFDGKLEFEVEYLNDM